MHIIRTLQFYSLFWVSQLFRLLMNRDYVAEALRTPDALGIGNLTAEQLGNL
jgi:hypothetical protein